MTVDPGTGSTVVFFPHAGGSPRFFRHLADALPGRRVFGVTYPGRDDLVDEPPLTVMPDLAERVAAELAERFATAGRLVLVGHSLGAFVAYEAAVLLQRSGAPVTVVASGQNPPDPDRTGHRKWNAAVSDDELVSDVVRQNPASAVVWSNPELRGFFLPTVRADYRLLGGYQPTGTAVEEVRVVAGRHDHELDIPRLRGWQRYSARPTDVTLLDGGHFYLNRPDIQLARFLTDLMSTHGARRATQNDRTRWQPR